MAAKKKTTKKTSNKGRRVGAVKKGQLMDLLQLFVGGAVGAVGRRFIDNAMSKQTSVVIKPETMQFIRVGEGLAGVGIAYFFDHPFVKGIGVGMASDAAVNVLQGMGQLSGIGATGPYAIELPRPNPNFSRDPLPSVAGAKNLYDFPSPPAVAGMDSRKYAGIYGH